MAMTGYENVDCAQFNQSCADVLGCVPTPRASRAGAAADGARLPGQARRFGCRLADRPDLGLHGLSSQQAGAPGSPARLPSLRAAVQPLLLRAAAVRWRG